MKVVLDKIILFCHDVTRLSTFYRDHLSLEILGEADPIWTVLNAGNVQIGLHKMGVEYLTPSNDPFWVESNVKLVFQLNTDLAEFRQRLITKQVDIDEIKHFAGANYIVCDGRDPEGNVFQLLQYI